MHLTSLRLLASLAVLGLTNSACGPPPQPVAEGGSTAQQQTMSDRPQAGPLDPNGSLELPPNHPPLAAGGGPAAGPAGGAGASGEAHRWDGAVRLRGGLAQLGEGYLFVNVKPEGVLFPSYSVKIPVTTGQPDGDDVVVPFEVTEDNVLGGLVPGVDNLVLEAYYDPDGFVESKEGQVRNAVPVEIDQTGVEVLLEN